MKSKILKFFTLFIIIPTMFIFSACSLGNQGLSAYELAVQNGYEGTVTEWLESLNGTNGEDGTDGLDGEYAGQGLSAYQIAVENGFTGTVTEWLVSLQGEKGDIGSDSVCYAVSKAILSVVSVYCEFTITSQYTHISETETSAGAGVILSDDKASGTAYIITNYHVVYYADADSEISESISIYLYGMEYEEYKISAIYIGGSLTYDIAVLKIENSTIYTNSDSCATKLENSNNVFAGDTAIAIGNPEAEGISATQGIISVDSEYISMTGADDITEVTFRVMRIDTAVNSGNSGGGLFNEDGELIGIVNAKTIEDTIENIAYAIPSNIAIYAANNIIRNSSTENTSILRCMLGVTLKI
ncbi:MAG: trypsin-like peptidase domain-containing protein, partial [Clostridia bacterium]|nr:trypsin-like peptidase domain-containing protein [Clostridia bacterium]